MQNTMIKENAFKEIKKISITKKRQITIPQKFFSMLGFETEAECIVRGNELILRPIKSNTQDDFAVEILKDLIAKGLSGEELLNSFKDTQKTVHYAIDAMLEDAENVANSNADYATYADVFENEN